MRTDASSWGMPIYLRHDVRPVLMKAFAPQIRKGTEKEGQAEEYRSPGVRIKPTAGSIGSPATATCVFPASGKTNRYPLKS